MRLRVDDRAALIEVGPRVHHPAVWKTPGRPGEAAIRVDEFDEPETVWLEVADPVEEAAQAMLHVRSGISALECHDGDVLSSAEREDADIDGSRPACVRGFFDLTHECRV